MLLVCSQSAHCRGARMDARGGPGQKVLMTSTTGGGQARIPKGRPENPRGRNRDSWEQGTPYWEVKESKSPKGKE